MKFTVIESRDSLAARSGRDFRWFEKRRCWYHFDSATRIWRPDDDRAIIRAAERNAQEMLREAFELPEDDASRKTAIWWARKSADPRILAGTVEQLKAAPGMTAGAETWDADPFLLACSNGAVDLRDSSLRPLERRDFVTRQCNAEFDPAAKSPLWDAFLDTLTGNDLEMRGFLQRSFGYALLGEWREKAFWFGYGPPDAGKSVLLNVVGDVLGSYHVSVDADTWMARPAVGGNRGDLTRLMGARLVTTSEVKPGCRFDQKLMKSVTGGDPVVAAAKYEAEISFLPQFALWLAANDRPYVDAEDAGFWRRMRCIPFNNHVPAERQDPHLRRKLASSEHAPAVLAWLVAGCREYLERGLGSCAAVDAASSEYREDVNPLHEFAEDRLIFDPEATTASLTLWEDYLDWSKQQQCKTHLSRKRFAGSLAVMGARPERASIKGEQVRVVRGVRLKPWNWSGV